MLRRGLVRLLVAVGAIAIAIGAPLAATPVSAGVDGGEAPVPVTVSDFYPEEGNLSDCLGLVERPGCGSEERGGWGQTSVFVLLILGMGFIFWRISLGVRANRRE